MYLEKTNSVTLFTALVAGLVYGGWAVYANFEYSSRTWEMAGIVQGVYAFFSTLSITHVARAVHIKYGSNVRSLVAGFVMSFTIMLCIPLAIHHIVGTRDIWQTILPGLVWGNMYLLGVCYHLHIKSIQLRKKT